MCAHASVLVFQCEHVSVHASEVCVCTIELAFNNLSECMCECSCLGKRVCLFVRARACVLACARACVCKFMQ